MDEQKSVAASTDTSDEKQPFWWDPAGYERTFVQNMRRMREKRQLSQTAFANLARHDHGLPFHQPTVQRIETGQRPIKISEAFAIAEMLGTTFAAMTEEKTLAAAYDQLCAELEPRGLPAWLERGALGRVRQLEARRDALQEKLSEYEVAAKVTGSATNATITDDARKALEVLDELVKVTWQYDTDSRMVWEPTLSRDGLYPRDFHGGLPEPFPRLDDDMPDDYYADYEVQRLEDERRGK